MGRSCFDISCTQFPEQGLGPAVWFSRLSGATQTGEPSLLWTSNKNPRSCVLSCDGPRSFYELTSSILYASPESCTGIRWHRTNKMTPPPPLHNCHSRKLNDYVWQEINYSLDSHSGDTEHCIASNRLGLYPRIIHAGFVVNKAELAAGFRPLPPEYFGVFLYFSSKFS